MHFHFALRDLPPFLGRLPLMCTCWFYFLQNEVFVQLWTSGSAKGTKSSCWEHKTEVPVPVYHPVPWSEFLLEVVRISLLIWGSFWSNSRAGGWPGVCWYQLRSSSTPLPAEHCAAKGDRLPQTSRRQIHRRVSGQSCKYEHHHCAGYFIFRKHFSSRPHHGSGAPALTRTLIMDAWETHSCLARHKRLRLSRCSNICTVFVRTLFLLETEQMNAAPVCQNQNFYCSPLSVQSWFICKMIHKQQTCQMKCFRFDQ